MKAKEYLKTIGIQDVVLNKEDLPEYWKSISSLMEDYALTSCFIEVIYKLPHSKSRVPYTYHHDYLRQKSKIHAGMSRSEVANSHTADFKELYAIALTQLANELGAKLIEHLDSKDIFVCKKAKEIADMVVFRYNAESHYRNQHTIDITDEYKRSAYTELNLKHKN